MTTFVQRLSARIDTLPPTIKPAALAAWIVVLVAMQRGAWYILPLAIVYVLVATAHPLLVLAKGALVAVLAVVGAALSGLAYGLVGRHLRTAFPGGYYLAGLVTIAPYMFVLSYAMSPFEGVGFGRPFTRTDLVVGGLMTLVFGLMIGRMWFGPKAKPARHGHRRS